jgi:hypothetical protein
VSEQGFEIVPQERGLMTVIEVRLEEEEEI